MKFTIIIPTLNAATQLNTTLNSLAIQTYRDFQCLVMDGNSSDTTVDIVSKYTDSIPGLEFHSAPDLGIYDAMNKGVSMTKGEYVLFLGTGDSLHNSTVLETVHTYLTNKTPDILYGDILLLPDTLLQQPKHLTNRFFRSGRMICHQSIFAKKATLSEYPFSLSYTYGADKDWLIHSFRNHKTFAHIPTTISAYDTTGFSSLPKNRKALWLESGKILQKYYGFIMFPITILKYHLIIKWH